MLTDIDECAEELHTCKLGMQGGMTCVNVPGSFRCECLPGFAKEGTICKGQYFKGIFIPGFLKTGLAKKTTHSTTWQFKTKRPFKGRLIPLSCQVG